MWYWLRNKIEEMRQKLRPLMVFVPFSPHNIILGALDKESRNLLEVGCGNGRSGEIIRRRRHFYMIGADIFTPFLKECIVKGTYDDCVQCDIRSLPFLKKSVDTLLCLAVVEHLDKEEGLRLIDAMEEVARKQVILLVPVGEWRQTSFGTNPYNRHVSLWYPDEFKKRGYKVRGYEVRNLCDQKGPVLPLTNVFPPITPLVWVLCGPFVYFLPRLAGNMVCVKNLSLKEI
jgi:SAM-dependent methyltransferase